LVDRRGCSLSARKSATRKKTGEASTRRESPLLSLGDKEVGAE